MEYRVDKRSERCKMRQLIINFLHYLLTNSLLQLCRIQCSTSCLFCISLWTHNQKATCKYCFCTLAKRKIIPVKQFSAARIHDGIASISQGWAMPHTSLQVTTVPSGCFTPTFWNGTRHLFSPVCTNIYHLW